MSDFFKLAAAIAIGTYVALMATVYTRESMEERPAVARSAN